jgi:hypothetical protein
LNFDVPDIAWRSQSCDRLFAGCNDLDQKTGLQCVRLFYYDWQPISTAPFDRDLELAVLGLDGPHALVFPCRRILEGWVSAETKEADWRQTHALAGVAKGLLDAPLFLFARLDRCQLVLGQAAAPIFAAALHLFR